MKPTTAKKKKINLALQGGGAHGAFTWGVLDRLLEVDDLVIEGISATSAGSMNAVVLAQGMMQGGHEGAKKLLYEFWHAMSDYGKLFDPSIYVPFENLLLPYLKTPVSYSIFNTITNLFSPYEFNPFNFHPIRDVLEKMIDVESLKKNCKIKLFICATNVQTGKIRIFNEDELSINVILASACLPHLFQAVEIDHHFYWDGGYLGDPAIFPLIYETNVLDIMVVHVVPVMRYHIPTTVAEIDTRLREISFNSSLMRELRAIAFVSKLIDKGWIKKEFKHQLKKLRMHCMIADDAMGQFSLASVYSPNWDFLLELHALGREVADNWLKNNYHHIGKKGTVNFNDWL
ncbi:MAG: alpha/beta hydrolase [Gammaproteobacteria bacterium RIFCSPHIGHO2_12_FULL_38_14]|nr:MAG: alpha/beta hydrolase [Gammaproteobacteria bacterium RIFCSPHIGHO2_12_FULL_38_14]